MRAVVAILTMFVLAWPCGAAAQTAVRPDRVIHLFDGKSLDHFYTWLVDSHKEDPLRVFTVVDQVDGAPAIRISGEKWGGIVTRESYRDYRLIVEFRWGLLTWGQRRNATRDSGVLVHAQGADGNTGRDFNGPWMRSVEAQIIEGGVGDIILVAGFEADGTRLTPRLTARAGKDRDGEAVFDPSGRGPRVRERPDQLVREGRRLAGQARLPRQGRRREPRRRVDTPRGRGTRATGSHTLVNGKVVNEGFRSSLTEGKILIQSEGAEIFFRRIDLEPAGEVGRETGSDRAAGGV